MTATTPLLPPTHLIDAPGTYISPSDPAWDHPRIEAELAELRRFGRDSACAAFLAEVGKPEADLGEAERAALSKAIAAGEEAEADRHPVLRFLAGYTRFQIDADLWTPEGKPCTVRDYLRGVTPASFLLVRPNRRRLRQVEAIVDTWDRREARIRAVVRCIAGPAGALSWSPSTPEAEVPEAVLEAMAAWNPALLRQVADACAAYCAPLRPHEGGR